MSRFSVDIGDEGAAYEQGVNRSADAGTVGAVAAVEGLSNLFRTFAPDIQPPKQPTQAEMGREANAQLAEALQATKGMNSLQKKTAVNAAISNYVAQGYEIDTNVSNLVTTTTGIDLEYLNFDPMQAAADEANKKLAENPAALEVARRDLEANGVPVTQENITQLALQTMQQTEADVLTIANTKVANEAEFIRDVLPKADSLLTNLTKQAAAALQIEASNGNVNPQTVVKLRANLDTIRALITKPAGVPQETFQQVQDRIDTLDNLMTRVENFDQDVLARTKADILEPIMMASMKQAEVIGQTDPLLAQVLLENPEQIAQTYMARKLPSIMENLSVIQPEALVYQDLELELEGILESVTGMVMPEGGITATQLEDTASILHTEAEFSQATDLSADERIASIELNTDLNVRGAKPELLTQSPTARKQFSAGVGKATVNIATSSVLVDDKIMGELYHPDTFASLKALKNIDPELYQLNSERLKNALQSQADKFATEAKGTFASSPFVVTGLGKVDFKTDNVAMPRAYTSGLLQRKADQYYDGNIFTMIRDGGAQLPRAERTELRTQGFDVQAESRRYSKVVKYNEKFKQYANWWKSLGGDPSVMEDMIVDKQETGRTAAPQGSLQNPFVIEWDEDSTEDEKIFSNLPSGTYYIGIDGNVYRKKM